jgi:hypothetical protein
LGGKSVSAFFPEKCELTPVFFRVQTCRRHYPGGPLGRIARGTVYSNRFLARQRLRPSPYECKVGAHMGRFEACSTFTRVTACLLAASPKRHMSLEGSDGFVTSTAAPIATGWSDPVAGWELHPLKTNTFARRTLAASPFPRPDLGQQAGRHVVGVTPRHEA